MAPRYPEQQFNISNVSLLGTPDVQLNPILKCNPTANLGTNQYINPSCFHSRRRWDRTDQACCPRILRARVLQLRSWSVQELQFSEGKRKLQFRFNAYNFLNHPLWSFNGTNLALGFNSNGTLSTPNFGTVDEKQGHRVVQAAVKFYF